MAGMTLNSLEESAFNTQHCYFISLELYWRGFYFNPPMEGCYEKPLQFATTQGPLRSCRELRFNASVNSFWAIIARISDKYTVPAFSNKAHRGEFIASFLERGKLIPTRWANRSPSILGWYSCNLHRLSWKLHIYDMQLYLWELYAHSTRSLCARVVYSVMFTLKCFSGLAPVFFIAWGDL